MIKSKVTYEIRYNGFYTNPVDLDNALINVFKVFDNDPEKIALFLQSTLKNRQVNKLANVLKETADEISKEDLLNLKIDPSTIDTTSPFDDPKDLENPF